MEVKISKMCLSTMGIALLFKTTSVNNFNALDE